MKDFINRIMHLFFNREMIAYLVVGVLTTVINIIAYNGFCNEMGIPNLIANGGAWVIAVLFAFAANDTVVFNGKSKKNNLLTRFYQFIFARLLSLLVDEIGMYILVDLVFIHNLIAKVSMNVIVIIINYILSKWLIFREEKEVKVSNGD